MIFAFSSYSGDGEIIPLKDDFYSYIDALFISAGNTIPSTSRPWTVSEARNELSKLNESKLNEKQKELFSQIDLNNYVDINKIKTVAGVDLAYWKENEEE